MSSRLETYQFDDHSVSRTTRKTVRRMRIAPILVALICALMAIAAVTVAQPDVNAPAIIG